ncbi:transthyretin [Cytidiella melzeri]|nr:transthyretin [Cytidiella melzeri]
MSRLPEKSPVTCHVLDSSLGKPAAGVRLALYEHVSAGPIGSPVLFATGRTDADGRCMQLWPAATEERGVKVEGAKLVAGGQYNMMFWVKEYFQETGRKCFYPVVEITFEVENPDEHYHIPLLISPYSYTTYRGS